MTRVHRVWHLRIWLALAPILAGLLWVSLQARAERTRLLESAAIPSCCRAHAGVAGGRP